MENHTENKTPVEKTATAATTQPNLGEIQTKSAISIASETTVLPENATQMGKLQRWFGILRQVCQENPRVVLKILQKPEALMLQSPDDALAARAEKLRWTVVEQEKARKEFEKNGVDPEKALGVINFLRNNVVENYYPKKKDGSTDYDQRIDGNYQYDAKDDAQYIAELANIGDDPVALLENLKNIINLDYQYSLKNLADYASLVANNPRAEEIIEKITVLQNLDKLNLGYNFSLTYDENGQAQGFFKQGYEEDKKVGDPLQTLANLDEKTYQELLSQENLQKVQELWTRMAGEEKIELEFLPGLLKLAHNPQLQSAFLKLVEVNSYYNYGGKNPFTEQFLESYCKHKFDWAIARLELMLQAVPEISDLLEDGFQLNDIFSFRFNTREAATNIDQFLNRKAEFLADFNDQDLRTKTRMLKKYGLSMPNKNETDSYLNFLRISDPDRLEKTLTIYEVTKDFFNRDNSDSYFTRMYDRFIIWNGIGNKLSNISTTDVAEVFELLLNQKAELANFDFFNSGILDDCDSIDTLRKRFENLLNPEIRKVVYDYDFNSRIQVNAGYRGKNYGWPAIFQNAEAYLALYEQKDLFYQRIKILKNEGLSMSSDLQSFNRLIQLTEDEFVHFKEDLLHSDANYKLQFDLFNLGKFDLLNNFNQDEKEQLLKELNYLDLKVGSLYGVNIESLQAYFNLSEADRQRVLDFARKLDNDFDLKISYFENNGTNIHLDFFCDLINNPHDQNYFIQYLDYLSGHLNEIETYYSHSSNQNIINQSTNFFKQLLSVHKNEADFALNDYIDQDGVITEKFLDEIINNNKLSLDYFVVSHLLTDDVLANMSEDGRQFWTFWQKSQPYVKKVLINHKERFNEFVIDNQPSYQLIVCLAKEALDELLKDKDSGLSDLSHYAENEKLIIITNILECLTWTPNLIDSNFNIIHRELSAHLKKNGQLNEALQVPFQQTFGFALTENFIKKLDGFYQDLHTEQYAALIIDPEAYWENNCVLLTKLEQLGWPIKNFDRFRSLVQNPVTNDILRFTNNELLMSLSKDIGLNPNNIFYMNKNSLHWLRFGLSDENRKAFFKRILNEKPSSFNSCIAAFASIDAKDVDRVITEPLYNERLLKATKEFGNITPSLITAYIMNPNENAREEYREKVVNFRRDIHRNVPIKYLAEGPGGLDFLADMIALTFPSTNINQIKADLSRLSDQCEQVANLQIREQGYQGQIVSKEKEAFLRDPNKKIDEGVINLIKVIFADQQTPEYLAKGGDEKFAAEGWARLLVEAGATNQKQLFDKDLNQVIACSRVSLGDKMAFFAEKMAGDTSQVSAKNTLLNKAKELFGIYYKDNAPAAIETFLTSHVEQANSLLAILSAKRLGSLEKNIANNKAMSEEDRLDFKEIISGLRQSASNPEQKINLLARLLAFMTERSIFAGGAGLRKAVSKESQKIVLKDKEGQEIDPNLIMTGYISKNAASFFAKNTAGVCTAGDFELFNRPDHFHVNLVNQEGIVLGNIQGYQFVKDGQPALIFRGFNPSDSFVSSANAEILCDQMVDMVKQIAADNNITQVFIPLQTTWHPLTNRVGLGEVADYFAKNFYRPEKAENFSFEIRLGKIITDFYRII